MGKGARRAWGIVDPVGAKLMGVNVSARDELIGGVVNPVAGLNGLARKATNDRLDFTSGASTQGALMGAATGAMLGGPAGAAIGAVAGGLMGTAQNYVQKDEELKMLKAEKSADMGIANGMSGLDDGGGSGISGGGVSDKKGSDFGIGEADGAATEEARRQTVKRGSFVGQGSRTFGFTTQSTLGG